MEKESVLKGEGGRRRKNQNNWDSDDEDDVTPFNTPKAANIEKTSTLKAEEVKKPVIEAEPDIAQLRKEARDRYILLRSDKQIQIFEAKANILEQDAEQYGFEHLTRQEQDEILLNREILKILQDKSTLEKGIDGYQLPQEYKDRKLKESLLYSKQNRLQSEKNINWEAQQIFKAQKTASGKNATKFVTPDEINLPGSEKYDYVFDQNIDFVDDAPLDMLEEDLVEPKSQLEVQVERETQRLKTMDQVRRSLPVYKFREQLLDAIALHNVLIIVGETGSGKTTQLPQYLHEAGYTKNGMKIGCTQPRRVAATSVATRVSDEMGVNLGYEVGYSVRFDDKTTDKTIIKYLTDGMLLREFLADPELKGYSAIMIDEAHERTLSTDILLSLCKDISRHRSDLKLLIASATINAKKFSEYFDDAPIFSIPGRRYPVDIMYTQQPEPNYIQALITTVFQIHTSQKAGSGDILVFLTGQEEIETMAESLAKNCTRLGDQINELIICPIYANLPSELQQKIFEPTPAGARKVVLATNIAETSITIDGIVYVIDSGFVKENIFNPTTGMESLVVVPCSQASADQRAGRAGRVGPGKCFRLFTKWAYSNELPKSTTPEILRVNLTSIVLLLLSLGINDLLHFDFMDLPSSETLMKSLELLYALGAMNERGQMTKLGRKMSEFPTDPMVAKLILKSAELSCVEEVITIMAMLGESGSLFYRPRDKREQADQAKSSFNKEQGDHLSLLSIYEQWEDVGFSFQWCRDFFLQYKTLMRSKNVRDQLYNLCQRLDLLKSDTTEDQINPEKKVLNIQKSITSGFFSNTSRLSRTGDSYKSIKKQQSVHIHPSSVLFRVKPPPKLLIYNELILTSKEYMRNVMVINESWLQELAPHYFNAKELEEIDTNTRKTPKFR